MISITNLSFYFGSRPLYENASLHIKPKMKIGLIGANGTGKSTLLRLITGEYQADGGSISRSSECTIGFLNQDLLSYQSDDSILNVAMQAFERQLLLQKEIDVILHKLETDHSESILNKLTRLQDEFETLGGYTMQAATEEILEGLGFSTADLERPLRQFSGGWRMRVMLAKLLLQKPALLMLDEPTNHLDLPSIEWVEEYLSDYEGAVIVVSHDRYFLENICDTTVEVSQQKLNMYSGPYSFYLQEKQLRNEIQKNAFENQQSKIRQTERFIDRFRAKASKARQVQSRVKMLGRMDKLEDIIDENAKVNFRFTFDQTSGKIVSTLNEVTKAYGTTKILDKGTSEIARGDKIALIGANGRGKSTLLRLLAGDETYGGEIKMGFNVVQSFFAQHQLESLNLENSMLEEMKQAGSEKNETELRTVLGCFLFTGDDVFKKIKVLSGGEKSRVALAKTLISKANFLLLDEPTNHLDIQSVNILVQALQQFEGSFVVVSHDRHFVSHIANKIWYIEDYELKMYPGTYEEYQYWLVNKALDEEEKEAAKPVKNKEKEAAPKVVQSADSEKKKADQQQLKKLRQEMFEVESSISQLEKQLKEGEAEMAKPSIYGNPDRLAEQSQLYEKRKKELVQKNKRWEELAALIDQTEEAVKV
jgi:ATP-binding cassette, subfamily F, member 3